MRILEKGKLIQPHRRIREMFDFKFNWVKNFFLKKDAVFFDHSFHKKTNSTKFAIDLLKESFELKVVFDHSWRKNNNPKIDLTNVRSYTFYMQILPSESDLKSVEKRTKLVWFPMYDALITSMDDAYLEELSKIKMKVICFSKAAYQILKKHNFNCKYFKYYPNPRIFEDKVHKNGFFQGSEDFTGGRHNLTNFPIVHFWYRRSPINWNFVKGLLVNLNSVRIIIKNDPDFKNDPLVISREDIKRFNVQTFNGFLHKNLYSNILSKSDIFIAPRVIEGIGQSVVECLARGLCVIAPDNPTMNEYIKNGVNGILYNIKNPRPVNLKNYRQLGMCARVQAMKGYRKWMRDKKQMISFISS